MVLEYNDDQRPLPQNVTVPGKIVFVVIEAVKKRIRIMRHSDTTCRDLHHPWCYARGIKQTRGAFPTDEAARKLLYLALLNLSRKRTRPIANWQAAINQFVIMYEDRVPIT